MFSMNKMPEAINRGDAKEMKKEKLNAKPRKVLVCFFQQPTFSSHADTHVCTQKRGSGREKGGSMNRTPKQSSNTQWEVSTVQEGRTTTMDGESRQPANSQQPSRSSLRKGDFSARKSDSWVSVLNLLANELQLLTKPRAALQSSGGVTGRF